MAAPYTTTSQIAGPVNFVFQETLLRNAKARCPYFVGAVPAEITSHGGTFSAKWRRIENLAPVSAPLSALTGNLGLPVRDSVQPSVTDPTATAQKYGNYILLNEEVDLVNFNGQGDKLSEILGINAGQSLNRLQRNELEDNATFFYVKSAGVSATGPDNTVDSKITRNAIAKAVTDALQSSSAVPFAPMRTGSTTVGSSPLREAYVGLCHNHVEHDIRGLTGFIAVEQYAGFTETWTGEFGAVGGVRWISSPEASTDIDSGAAVGATGLRSTGGSNIDLYSCPIFGMEAVGSLGLDFKFLKDVYQAGDKLPPIQMIKHDKGSAGALDPLNEYATMGWKAWHAAKILNAAWIRTLRCGASNIS
jgi:N4-gp56 family major capsid protein